MPVSVPVGDEPVEHVEVRRGEYHDSVTLMLAARAVAGVAGVERVLVAMATELNVALLAELGYPAVEEVGVGDLIVAFACPSAASEAAALEALAHALTPAIAAGGSITAPEHTPAEHPPARTTASALGRTSAPITLISTPGLASVAEAMESLEHGANPIIFSDNVPIDHEVRLKEEARRRGLLVMGPDCGTVVLHGTGLAFANVTSPGPISLVAASGTGAQQLMALLDAAGTGIRHCLGVGGRDLTEQVAGRSTLAAMTALAEDEHTQLITVVSKPPHPTIAAHIRAHAETLGKPVHFAFVGPEHPNLTEAAEQILAALGRGAGAGAGAGAVWPRWEPAEAAGQVTAPGRAAMVRGLFSGGTLRAEAEVVLARAGGQMIDNGKAGGRGAGESRRPQSSADRADGGPDFARADGGPDFARADGGPDFARADEEPDFARADEGPDFARADQGPDFARADQGPDFARADGGPDFAADAEPHFTFNLTDFGDDAYTRGRPHPMIDNTLRLRAIADAAADADVRVLLLDVVLGRGAHADPGTELAAAVTAARASRPGVAVVVSLCGTAGDPQGLGRQAEVLAGAGAWVFLSNAEAAGAAARLALGGVPGAGAEGH